MSEKYEKSVLSPKLSAGPHGVGDPDDKSLRTSERTVLIPQLMRERSKKVKCLAEVREFEQCALDNGILLPFKCQPQNHKMKDCLGYWFNNEAFKEECTQIYLDERSEYRRTGISKKQQLRAEAERQKLLKKIQEQQQHSQNTAT